MKNKTFFILILALVLPVSSMADERKESTRRSLYVGAGATAVAGAAAGAGYLDVLAAKRELSLREVAQDKIGALSERAHYLSKVDGSPASVAEAHKLREERRALTLIRDGLGDNVQSRIKSGKLKLKATWISLGIGAIAAANAARLTLQKPGQAIETSGFTRKAGYGEDHAPSSSVIDHSTLQSAD